MAERRWIAIPKKQMDVKPRTPMYMRVATVAPGIAPETSTSVTIKYTAIAIRAAGKRRQPEIALAIFSATDA
jgi:hypothetical protein